MLLKKINVFLLKAIFISHLSTFTTSANIYENRVDVIVSDLNCANNAQKLIPLLGRGADFPKFIIDDITNELLRQDKNTNVTEVKCTEDVKVQARTVEVNIEGETKQALSALTITFPLTIKLENKRNRINLDLELSYQADNLDTPGQQTVTQHFKVIKQY